MRKNRRLHFVIVNDKISRECNEPTASRPYVPILSLFLSPVSEALQANP